MPCTQGHSFGNEMPFKSYTYQKSNNHLVVMYGYVLHETLARWLSNASQHQSGQQGAILGANSSIEMEDPIYVASHVSCLRDEDQPRVRRDFCIAIRLEVMDSLNV